MSGKSGSSAGSSSVWRLRNARLRVMSGAVLPSGRGEVKPCAVLRPMVASRLTLPGLAAYTAAMTTYLTTPQGRHIAYDRTPGKEPGVVFLGGFRSDMTGTKALHLQAWAEAAGRAFLRFDYSGHGASRGRFDDGAISDWREDALAVIESADRRAAGAGRLVHGRLDRASSGAGHGRTRSPAWSASPPRRISPKTHVGRGVHAGRPRSADGNRRGRYAPRTIRTSPIPSPAA